MKELIKGRKVSAKELAKLTATDTSGITYDDIEKMFSSEDLTEYNLLCKCFINLIGDKSNKEQWELLLEPTPAELELVSALNRIQELREKYSLPGAFHILWRATPLKNGDFEYDEISW